MYYVKMLNWNNNGMVKYYKMCHFGKTIAKVLLHCNLLQKIN